MQRVKLTAKENQKQMILDELRQVKDADFYEDGPAAWHTLVNGLERKCPELAKFTQANNIQPGKRELLQLLEKTILSTSENVITPVIKKN